MEHLDFGQHTSKEYNQDLEGIRNMVLEMGGLVEKQVSDAMIALLESKSELGEIVEQRDVDVNALEVKIDEACTQIIAKRQPAASDLRLVMAVIKTITDLERAGDEAEKIGYLAIKLATDTSRPAYYQDLEQLGQMVKTILSSALDAFARLDAEAAFEIAKSDKKIDAEFEKLSRVLITHMMEDNREIKNVLRVSWIARALERIGDHSKNICEYIIYLVKGKDVRHTSLKKIRKQLFSD